MNYLLWELHDGRPIEAVVLRPGKTVFVGRWRTNDLRLRDPDVSLFHIEVQHDGHSVRARSSCHSGFRVRGRHCGQVELQPSDLIQLGPVRELPQLRLDVAPIVVPVWLAWQKSTVPCLPRNALGEAISRSDTLCPTRLAVTADALEDAGCTYPDLLGHLRSPGPHVRGCWAVDLVLGKGFRDADYAQVRAGMNRESVELIFGRPLRIGTSRYAAAETIGAGGAGRCNPSARQMARSRHDWTRPGQAIRHGRGFRRLTSE
jgi:hypothetical protein